MTNDLQAASKALEKAIDKATDKLYPSEHRSHLGASIIGVECERELWYVFRWVTFPNHKPRLKRLFQRGKREEEELIKLLKTAGVEILEEQMQMQDIQGHFGGSADGIASFNGNKVILEFKTSGTGRKFNEIVKDGVRKAKPQHFVQMCLYGYYLDIKHGLYIVVNKNDDSLHVELVELDEEVAKEHILKAEKIIGATEAPRRISEDANFYICNACQFKYVCHHNEMPQKNCRSCKMASPDEQGQWFCGMYNMNIPQDFIPKGCDKWEPIG